MKFQEKTFFLLFRSDKVSAVANYGKRWEIIDSFDVRGQEEGSIAKSIMPAIRSYLPSFLTRIISKIPKGARCGLVFDWPFLEVVPLRYTGRISTKDIASISVYKDMDRFMQDCASRVLGATKTVIGTIRRAVSIEGVCGHSLTMPKGKRCFYNIVIDFYAFCVDIAFLEAVCEILFKNGIKQARPLSRVHTVLSAAASVEPLRPVIALYANCNNTFWAYLADGGIVYRAGFAEFGIGDFLPPQLANGEIFSQIVLNQFPAGPYDGDGARPYLEAYRGLGRFIMALKHHIFSKVDMPLDGARIMVFGDACRCDGIMEAIESEFGMPVEMGSLAPEKRPTFELDELICLLRQDNTKRRFHERANRFFENILLCLK